jgi:hypothetical protein
MAPFSEVTPLDRQDDFSEFSFPRYRRGEEAGVSLHAMSYDFAWVEAKMSLTQKKEAFLYG